MGKWGLRVGKEYTCTRYVQGVSNVLRWSHDVIDGLVGSKQATVNVFLRRFQGFMHTNCGN